jgi:hypothetical protein
LSLGLFLIADVQFSWPHVGGIAASPFLERDKFSLELILCERFLQNFATSPFFLDP